MTNVIKYQDTRDAGMLGHRLLVEAAKLQNYPQVVRFAQLTEIIESISLTPPASCARARLEEWPLLA